MEAQTSRPKSGNPVNPVNPVLPVFPRSAARRKDRRVDRIHRIYRIQDLWRRRPPAPSPVILSILSFFLSRLHDPRLLHDPRGLPRVLARDPGGLEGGKPRLHRSGVPMAAPPVRRTQRILLILSILSFFPSFFSSSLPASAPPDASAARHGLRRTAPWPLTWAQAGVTIVPVGERHGSAGTAPGAARHGPADPRLRNHPTRTPGAVPFLRLRQAPSRRRSMLLSARERDSLPVLQRRPPARGRPRAGLPPPRHLPPSAYRLQAPCWLARGVRRQPVRRKEVPSVG